jgi:hypothetical protein
MQILSLFKFLNLDSELIIYLFEHRDESITLEEVAHLCSPDRFETLESVELIETIEHTISLDQRVVGFIEQYLDIEANIEISIIEEKLDLITHKIEILKQSQQHSSRHLLAILRQLKKIDFILLQNMIKLRLHIDRIYKGIDSFQLKISELKYYQKKLEELSKALAHYQQFLKQRYPYLYTFMFHELNTLITQTQHRFIEYNTTLIALTQDVISYINQAQMQSIFIEKITKLKALKDRLELNESSDIEQKVDKFTLLLDSITIKTRLDDQIIDESIFGDLLKKLQSAKIKKPKAPPIAPLLPTVEITPINITTLHHQFRSTSYDLFTFLQTHTLLKESSFTLLCETYCKMILRYEIEYIISPQTITIEDATLKKVFYDNRFE